MYFLGCSFMFCLFYSFGCCKSFRYLFLTARVYCKGFLGCLLVGKWVAAVNQRINISSINHHLFIKLINVLMYLLFHIGCVHRFAMQQCIKSMYTASVIMFTSRCAYQRSPIIPPPHSNQMKQNETKLFSVYSFLSEHSIRSLAETTCKSNGETNKLLTAFWFCKHEIFFLR